MRAWAVKTFQMPWRSIVRVARVCAAVIVLVFILMWLLEKLCRWSSGR